MESFTAIFKALNPIMAVSRSTAGCSRASSDLHMPNLCAGGTKKAQLGFLSSDERARLRLQLTDLKICPLRRNTDKPFIFLDELQGIPAYESLIGAQVTFD